MNLFDVSPHEPDEVLAYKTWRTSFLEGMHDQEGVHCMFTCTLKVDHLAQCIIWALGKKIKVRK